MATRPDQLIELLNAPPDVSGLPQAIRDDVALLLKDWNALPDADRKAAQSASVPSFDDAVQAHIDVVNALATKPGASDLIKAQAATLAASQAAALGTGKAVLP